MIKDIEKIKIWEQYGRSEALRNYFRFFRKYIKENYFDLFYKYNEETGKVELGEYAKEFSINQAQSDYLAFYLKSIYNMMRPHYLVEQVFYDIGLRYDDEYYYDATGDTYLVPLSLLKKMFTFIYGVKYDYFSIPNLAGMIADFCDVNITQVRIEIDTMLLKSFKIYMPSKKLSRDLRTVYNTYRNLFNLPIGFSMAIVTD